jgi:hypothetical protein
MMLTRTVKDAEGRTWTCTTNGNAGDSATTGKDVQLTCTTESIATPVLVTVGWSWEKTSENGLARMIVAAAKAA